MKNDQYRVRFSNPHAQDRTLWCVSSWNDHGQGYLAANATRLLRSDFFPGLGWMLRAELWHELRPGW